MSVLQTQHYKKDAPRAAHPDIVLTNGGTKDFVTPLGTVLQPSGSATVTAYELSQIPAATLSTYSITVSGGGRVVTGLKIDEGSSASDLVLGISAGELRKGDGTYVSVGAAASAATIGTAPGAGNKRIDLISIKESDSTIVVTAGTAVANSATASAPATPSGNIALARVAVGSSVTSLANDKITDVRPRL